MGKEQIRFIIDPVFRALFAELIWIVGLAFEAQVDTIELLRDWTEQADN